LNNNPTTTTTTTTTTAINFPGLRDFKKFIMKLPIKQTRKRNQSSIGTTSTYLSETYIPSPPTPASSTLMKKNSYSYYDQLKEKNNNNNNNNNKVQHQPLIKNDSFKSQKNYLGQNLVYNSSGNTNNRSTYTTSSLTPSRSNSNSSQCTNLSSNNNFNHYLGSRTQSFLSHNNNRKLNRESNLTSVNSGNFKIYF
jgi:hypothetical protein